MIKVSILYPHTPDGHFDFAYYVNRHMPLSISLLRAHPGFKSVSVERGLAGADPQAELPYVAMCHFLFDAVESFIAAFTPHAATLQGDMPNYTNIAPLIQFNEVLLSQ